MTRKHTRGETARKRCPYALVKERHNEHQWWARVGLNRDGVRIGLRVCPGSVGVLPRKPHARNVRADFLERLKREWRPGMSSADTAQAMGVTRDALLRMVQRCRSDGDLPASRAGVQVFDPLGVSEPSWTLGVSLYPSDGRVGASGARASRRVLNGSTVRVRGPKEA